MDDGFYSKIAIGIFATFIFIVICLLFPTFGAFLIIFGAIYAIFYTIRKEKRDFNIKSDENEQESVCNHTYIEVVAGTNCCMNCGRQVAK